VQCILVINFTSDNKLLPTATFTNAAHRRSHRQPPTMNNLLSLPHLMQNTLMFATRLNYRNY